MRSLIFYGHKWRGIAMPDGSRLWPFLVLGWITIEFLPNAASERVSDILRTVRQRHLTQRRI